VSGFRSLGSGFR